MSLDLPLSLIALAGLLLLVACGPAAAPSIAPTVSVSWTPALSGTEGDPVEPTQPATAPPTEPAATPTAVPPDEGQGNADVLRVRAVQAADESWTFSVTVEHPDTGWEDYADGWDVATPSGVVLKPDPDSPFTRLLLHPHVDEQPFTRSQSGIVIPAGVSQVRVRAHDLVDGWGGREIVVDLSRSSGPGLEVER